MSMTMNEPAVSTVAVLVVYRLAADIEPTLVTLRAAVGRVLVVDNHESGHAGLEALARGMGIGFLRAGNVGGLAGAYNRALAWLKVHGAQMRHVVFLDEDSDVGVLRDLLADATSVRVLDDPRAAAIAPAYRDRATGLRGRYIRLGRWRLSYNPREFPDLRAVAFVINSMSVWRLQALQRIGPFNERLAIDHVDTEYCLRARRLGLALYVHGSHEFAHSIGQRRRFRFLGREMQAGGHGPERRYLIGRNTSWLARSWLWREPAFAFLCATRLAYEAVGIVVVEDRALAKLGALLRGALTGLVMPRSA